MSVINIFRRESSLFCFLFDIIPSWFHFCFLTIEPYLSYYTQAIFPRLTPYHSNSISPSPPSLSLSLSLSHSLSFSPSLSLSLSLSLTLPLPVSLSLALSLTDNSTHTDKDTRPVKNHIS